MSSTVPSVGDGVAVGGTGVGDGVEVGGTDVGVVVGAVMTAVVDVTAAVEVGAGCGVGTAVGDDVGLGSGVDVGSAAFGWTGGGVGTATGSGRAGRPKQAVLRNAAISITAMSMSTFPLRYLRNDTTSGEAHPHDRAVSLSMNCTFVIPYKLLSPRSP